MKSNRRLQIYIMLIIAGFCVIAAFAVNDYDETHRNITVTVNDPIFVIKLKSNPTTGYSWILQAYDSKLINLMSHRYVRPSTNLIGASGYEIWTFSVQPDLVIGAKTTIQLRYARPWQPTVNSQSLIFTVSMTK